MAFISSPLTLLKSTRSIHSGTTVRKPCMTATDASISIPRFAPGVITLENEGAYAVMAAANKLEATTGQQVIHLEIGQPGFETPPVIADAAIKAIRSGRTKYSDPAGTPALREKIAQWCRENRSMDCLPENVIVGPGAKPGLFFSTLALIRGPHDRVIIPDPGFPTYKAMVNMAGGTCVPVKLRSDHKGFDMKAFRAAVDERTRLVVLNSPGNPTGGVMPIEDLREVSALARELDFWVMSDEIYAQLCYEDKYTSIASLPGMSERTVVVDGFSKSYCMTGWRLGWSIMPRDLAERVKLLMVHSVGCTATFVQEAGIVALESAEKDVQQVREQYRRRRDIVVNGLDSMAGVKCETPQGAFYAWADVSSFRTPSKKIAEKLLYEGLVAVLPGTDFGAGGEGFIRLSYVGEEEVLREGLQRIESTLAKM